MKEIKAVLRLKGFLDPRVVAEKIKTKWLGFGKKGGKAQNLDKQFFLCFVEDKIQPELVTLILAALDVLRERGINGEIKYINVGGKRKYILIFPSKNNIAHAA